MTICPSSSDAFEDDIMMLHRRVLLAAGILAVAGIGPAGVPALADDAKKPAPPPPAADAKPDDIVKNLYDRYAAGAFDYLDDKLRPRYFSKATDELLKKVFDKSTKDDEPGIDYEPLIDGQEGEVKGLSIVVASLAPPKATVEARFTSFDDKMVVTFEFVQEHNNWKIDDIKGREGNSLKGVAKEFLQQ
jgi:Protein of unknown function (DUF3828)